MRAFSLLVVAALVVLCPAEDSSKQTKDDLQESETFGFGFYTGAYPVFGKFGGFYGYPYYGYPYKKFFGYPYYGIRAYPAIPALPVWP